MTDFVFTSPEGKQYRVSGPEGADPKEALQRLQRKLAGMPDLPAAPKDQTPSGFLPRLGYELKGIPAGIARGLAGTASASGGAAQIEMGQPVDVPDAEQGKKLIEQNVTGPLPKGGRFGQAAGEAIGSPTSYIGPGGLLAKMAGAAGSALGSEAASAATEGTRFEPYARIAGSLAGGFPFGRWRTPQANAKFEMPLAEDLFEAGDKQLNAARNMDVRFRPQPVANAAEEAAARLTDRDLTKRIVPKTWEVVEELRAAKGAAPDAYVRGGSVMRAMGELKAIARENPGTSESSAAWQVIERLSKFLAGHSERDVISGDSQKFKQLFDEGSANWAAGKRLDMLSGQIKLGNFNAATAHSGRNVDNSLRQAIKQLIRPRPGKKTLAEQHGFSPREIKAMEEVQRGNATRNTIRYFGNLLAGGGGWGQAALGLGGLAAGSAAGYETGHTELGSLLGLGLGLGFRSAANALARREAAKVLGTVAERSPLARESSIERDMAKATRRIKPKMKTERAGAAAVRTIPQITVHPRPRSEYGGPQ